VNEDFNPMLHGVTKINDDDQEVMPTPEPRRGSFVERVFAAEKELLD